MTGYTVCVYKNIKDQSKLKEYALAAKSAVEKFKGKFLVRGGEKITAEGKESPRTVVIEFPTFDDAKNFYFSKEYQKAHSILGDTVERHFQILKGSNIE
tara:strand:+ start:1412 stop:1708 length:297 start_codon:yes stop_codon:yes gene_type:complete